MGRSADHDLLSVLHDLSEIQLAGTGIAGESAGCFDRIQHPGAFGQGDHARLDDRRRPEREGCP